MSGADIAVWLLLTATTCAVVVWVTWRNQKRHMSQQMTRALEYKMRAEIKRRLLEELGGRASTSGHKNTGENHDA